MADRYRLDLTTKTALRKEIKFLEGKVSTKINTNNEYHVNQDGDFDERDALNMLGRKYGILAAEYDCSSEHIKKVYNSFWPESSSRKSPTCMTNSVGKLGHDMLMETLIILRKRLAYFERTR